MSLVEFGMMEPFFSIEVLVAALGGGLFAAAIGPLWSFIFTGFLVIGGVAMEVANPEAGGMLWEIAFGPFFGPHVAFVGGVAATTLARKKGYLETGRNILASNIEFSFKDPSLLLCGALFGALGYILFFLFNHTLGLLTDNIALTVAVGNLLARVIILGQSPLGSPPAGVSLADRFSTAKVGDFWLPNQAPWLNTLLIGLGVGAISAFATLLTGNAFIGFGITAASLICVQTMGGEKGIATHHMALPAGLAAAATGDIFLGLLWGAIGAIIGEIAARLFICHGDNHIDPPAIAIFITTTLIALTHGLP